MAIWAHENGVLLRFIEPGKPNQNPYVDGRPIVLAGSKE
jgi:hypothetical protein